MPRCRRLRASVLLLASTLIASPGAAQVEGDLEFTDNAAAAYAGLLLTPVGALPARHDFLLRPANGIAPAARLHFGFGHVEYERGVGQRAYAATLDVPISRGVLSATAGYLDVRCDEDEVSAGFGADATCGGGIMLGGRLGAVLAERALDATGGSSLLVGVEGTFGYTDLDVLELEDAGDTYEATAKAMSATIALPIALSLRSGDIVIAPGIRPAVGWGRTKFALSDGGGSDSASGIRAMLGASIALRFGERLGVDAGLQRIFFEEADTVLGLGMSVGF